MFLIATTSSPKMAPVFFPGGSLNIVAHSRFHGAGLQACQLAAWHLGQLVGLWVRWVVGLLPCWRVGLLAGRLYEVWLSGLVVGCLASWLDGVLVCWLVGRYTIWRTGWAGWLVGCPTARFRKEVHSCKSSPKRQLYGREHLGRMQGWESVC